MQRTRWWGAVFSAVLSGWTGAAHAANLDKPECDALRSEEAMLVNAGVRADMQRGPEWAKANLAPERLEQVKRLIELGEQLAFRCEPQHPPVEAKVPAKGRQAGTGEKSASSTGAAVDEAIPTGEIIGGQLQPGEPAVAPRAKKSKAAKRSAKRPPSSAAKAKSADATKGQ